MLSRDKIETSTLHVAKMYRQTSRPRFMTRWRTSVYYTSDHVNYWKTTNVPGRVADCVVNLFDASW